MALAPGIRADLASYAASAYCAKLTNKANAAVLLESENEGIRDLALARMIGCEIDTSIWEKLKTVLASGTARQMGLVAAIAHHDPGGMSANEKASVLIKGFQRLEFAAGAKKRIVGGEWNMVLTESEIAWGRFARALMSLRGLETQVLMDLTPKDPGNLRDCVLIARRYRGDSTVNENMHRIVLQNPLVSIRSLGISTIAGSGRPEDIPALRRVAEGDPAVISNYSPHIPRSEEDMTPRVFYPLRTKATEGINRISSREK